MYYIDNINLYLKDELFLKILLLIQIASFITAMAYNGKREAASAARDLFQSARTLMPRLFSHPRGNGTVCIFYFQRNTFLLSLNKCPRQNHKYNLLMFPSLY